MSKQEELFFLIGNSISDVVISKMFGKLCYKINGKAFACFYNGSVAFKLNNDSYFDALSQDGAKLFDPSGKNRPMKEWVEVPFSQDSKWEFYANAALAYVNSIN